MSYFRNSAFGTLAAGFLIALCVALTLLVVFGAVFDLW